jgi:ubiquinone/menaquinone biosynthesis C-methylase UbiE
MATAVPWDLVSSAYAEEVTPVFEGYARDALRLAAPPAGARILDVACGPGTLSFIAAQQGHPVDALDFSPLMIEKLEHRKRAQSVTAVTAQVGDGQHLPYDDATFGAAFSMFGLMFFPDRAQGRRELRRVLVPGARAVVSSWHRLEGNPVMSAMFSVLRETMNKLLGPAAPQPGSQEMPLVTEEQCRAEMSEVFADVEVHSITHQFRYGSVQDVWPSIERTMAPLVMMRKGMGEEKWAPLSKTVNAAVVASFGDKPAVMEMPAWLTVGTAR